MFKQIHMVHKPDDDTDMYNTPYTYNAGRTGFLARDEYCMLGNAWKHFTLTFLSLFEPHVFSLYNQEDALSLFSKHA